MACSTSSAAFNLMLQGAEHEHGFELIGTPFPDSKVRSNNSLESKSPHFLQEGRLRATAGSRVNPGDLGRGAAQRR